MTRAAIEGLVRHLMTFGGGYVTAGGVVDQEMWQQLIGAAATLAGIAWSIWQKRQAARGRP